MLGTGRKGFQRHSPDDAVAVEVHDLAVVDVVSLVLKYALELAIHHGGRRRLPNRRLQE